MCVASLHFLSVSSLITTESPMYYLPSIPPADDWTLSVDKEGKELSRYGDSNWDYKAFEGGRNFNWGIQNLSTNNERLAKNCMLFILYHPALFPGKIISCKAYFVCLVNLAKQCDKEGILMSELSRFPLVQKAVGQGWTPQQALKGMRLLHNLSLFKNILGFEVADKKALSFLATLVKEQESIQTPYIPPRIWSYQINRLSECIDDFRKHQSAINAAFNALSDAYEHNSKIPTCDETFNSPFNATHLYKQRIIYEGGFISFLRSFGLLTLLEKWLGKKAYWKCQYFSTYLNLIRSSSILYILNFSLQRISEAGSLKSDCFRIERDERMGDIALISGVTTKTDPDNDAVWVVPKTVKKAIDAAATVAEWRKRHCPQKLSTSENDRSSAPWLSTPTWEPWGGGRGGNKKAPKVLPVSYVNIVRSYPELFSPRMIQVTEEDWKIALSLTPNLDKKDGFGIGKPWKFATHQLRRTGVVNMFSSNMVSSSSLQWEMKHLSRKMTLYYGRNHYNLRLNSELETAVIVESYKAIYRKLVAIVDNDREYLTPRNKECLSKEVINLIETREENQLTKLIKEGKVGCRSTLLGYCMKVGTCEYGGIESVANCAGLKGGSICTDAVFKRGNNKKLMELKKSHEIEMTTLEADSPRYNALKAEVYALEVYFDVINR